MTIRALSHVYLENPIGHDREHLSMSTIIASQEFHVEADYHNGRIGDVNIYINTNAHKPGEPANWQWYGGIPTANIKSYKLAGDLPPAVAAPKPNAERQTQAATQATQATRA